MKTSTVSILLLLAFAGTAHAEGEKPRKRRHVRMAAELSAIMTIGHRWYWRDGGKPNEVDWQLPWDGRAVEAKLGADGWRFDGNAYHLNALGHPGFGMLTHFLARRNGYGLGESFLISTVASGAWEVFVEWAEYGSVNDMAATSPAGVPLGETLHQMASHLGRTDFEVRSGVGSENGASFVMLGASGELDLIPTTGDGTFHGGRRVSFTLEVPADESVRSYQGGARTTIAGYYRNRPGASLFAGISAGFDYRNQLDRPERAGDLLTTVELGPTVDLRVQRAGVTVDLGADVHGDFAMLKSQAFDAWREANPDAVVRNVMETQPRPYYYALGASIDPRVDVSYRGYRVGGELAGSHFGSLDGQDRDQEMLTADPHMSDRDARAAAWLGYTRGDVSVLLEGRGRKRAGKAGAVEASSEERSAIMTVAYRL